MKKNENNKGVIPLFCYRDLNKDHKSAAQECIRILSEFNQPMLIELIKNKFKLVEHKKFDLNNSEFIKKAKEVNITTSVQGYIIENDIEYQVIGITEDIRKLEEFVKLIKK